MPTRSVARVLAVLAMASAVSWLGCGGGAADLAGPEPGSLDVTIATSGPEPDTDGYTLSIDGAAAEAIAVNASRHTEGLLPGNHTVALAGLAGNCTVGTGTGVTVEVLAGAAAAVRFEVACAATTGTVEVVTTSAGSPPDADGYQLQLDGAPAQPIGISATVSIPGVAPGVHTVGLGGLAANCAVDGDNPRSATVEAGATVSVAISVICTASPAPGSIGVTTSTSGPDPDPDGYAISLDGAGAIAIGTAATVSLPNLPAGPHTVGLSGLSANCHLDGDNPRPVTVSSGAVAPVAFTITCTALPPSTGALKVTTTTTGTPVDPDGYTVSIDNGSPGAVGTNASVTVAGLVPGPHTVRLGGLAANCSPQGENPRTVTVVAGETATTTFAVTCTATTGALTVTITGLPAGTSAAVTVTGPNSFSRAVTATATLADLTPGSYTVAAADVANGGTQYTPSPKSRVVSVAAAATASAAVAYAAVAGPSLNLRIDGWFLTQSVQSPAGDVPLIENRDGFLRVFVVADGPNTAAPKVRVRVYRNGTLARTFDIPAPGTSTPQSRNEDDLASSWNVKIPRDLFGSGLTVLADVDPANAIAEKNESDNSYPVSGTAQSESMRSVPPLGVRFVPVKQQPSGLTGDVSAANKGSFLDLARRMLPITTADGDVHEVYTATTGPLQPTDGNGAWLATLGEINALRVAEGTTRSYYGVVQVDYASGIAGLGFIGLPTAMGYDLADDRSRVMAHELGHTFGRLHSPCGQPGGVDPNYPYIGGLTGAYGYDVQNDVLKSPFLTDIMGYCGNPWISDYTYAAMLAFRSAGQNASAAAAAAAPQRCLLVWGRIVDGRAVLEPAFEIVTRPSLPRSRGPYTVEAARDDGSRLFSLSFEAHEVGDSRRDARQFAFAVPLGGISGDQVGSLRLSGPGGEAAAVRAPAAPGPLAAARAAGTAVEARAVAGGVALRWDAAARPMVMVRDPDTGEVLSFARGGQANVVTTKRTLDLVVSDRVGSREVRVTAGQ
jgi:hypothetical protein